MLTVTINTLNSSISQKLKLQSKISTEYLKGKFQIFILKYQSKSEEIERDSWIRELGLKCILRSLSWLGAQFPQKEVYPLKFCFQNLATGIKRIAEFFGFSPSGEQIQTISAQSTFHAMQAKSQETHGAVGPFLFRKGKAALISEPSIRLHITGNSNNFMLKKTGFSLSLPQQEVWHRSELELVTPRCFRVLSSFQLSLATCW